jgi:hypothetical protein
MEKVSPDGVEVRGSLGMPSSVLSLEDVGLPSHHPRHNNSFVQAGK